jgi:hypothetical protein
VRIVDGLAEGNPPSGVFQVADFAILDGNHAARFDYRGVRGCKKSDLG